MFLIILFYVALPFLAAMIKNLSCKEVGLYVCWSLFLFILPSLYHWGGTISQTTFLDRLFKDFFSMGLSYFFVGWLACQDTCVSRWLTAHPQKGTALLVGILGLCVLLPLLYEYLHHASMPYLHDTWQSPFVFAGGIALFLLLQQHGEGIRCGRSLISGVAKASFGIFLVHFLFLFPLVEFIPRWIGPCSKDVMTFILFFFDFFLGWGLTVILVQFKLTKWLVA